MSQMPEILNTITVANVASTVAIIGTIGIVIRKAVPPMRRLLNFLDDISGEAPRPGLPQGRPGIMDRLARVETKVDSAAVDAKAARALSTAVADQVSEVKTAVEQVRREFDNNGGSSTIDLLTHIAEAVGAPVNQPVPQNRRRGPL